MTDRATEEFVNELETLLQGDTGYRMAEGDVEFFEASPGILIVEVRGRRYEIVVRDVGPSARAAMKPITPLGKPRL